ncbi:MAG: hypothetical protein JEY94_02135 [Melioribacteraceae bacterium]|nr:hypothetical protein [Melioribacteraceae bacterium]
MKISIKDTIIEGARKVSYNTKFVWLLLASNLAFAFILSTPIYFILTDNLGSSLLSQRLLHNFDIMWYIQLRSLYENTFGAIPIVIYAVVAVYSLIQTFFLGGLITIFNTPKKNHFVDFFYGCVKYWFRFTKVLIVSLLFFVAAFIFNDYLGDFIGWVFKDYDALIYDFIFRSLRYVLLIFLIGIISGFSDYIKTSMVIDENNGLFKSIGKVIILLRQNFSKIFSVYLFVAVIGALGAVVYNVVERFIPDYPHYFLILTFFLQQMLIIFRLLIRMLFCSTEVILYKDLSAEVVSAEVEEQNLGEL